MKVVHDCEFEIVYLVVLCTEVEGEGLLVVAGRIDAAQRSSEQRA